MNYLFLLFAFFAYRNTPLESVDLLEKYADKPANLTFVACKAGTGQTVLEAEYMVLGKDAKAVEDFLVKQYGLGEMTFTCCGWESKDGKNGSIENAELKQQYPNYVLDVSMYGNAEIADENGDVYLERDRDNIVFYVKVKLLDI
jgi:hypothetical protein